MPQSKDFRSLSISYTDQQVATPAYDAFAASDGLDSEDQIEKDETETELEKLVFGDDFGFHEALKASRAGNATRTLDVVDSLEQEDEAGTGAGLEGINDADVSTARPVRDIVTTKSIV